jgi:transglutaminase-like putative cysteine protease
MEVYFGDSKAGYGHSSMVRTGDVIETTTIMKLAIGRADQPIRMSVMQSARETIDGRPLSFANETDMSIQKTNLRGEVKDGKITITSEQFGIEQKQTFDLAPSALMSWGVYREGIKRGFEEGTAYTLDVYSPDMRLDAPVQAATRIGAWEEVALSADRRVRGRRVTMSLETPFGKMDMVTWADEQGRPLVAESPVPGLGNLRMITTDQKTALTHFVPREIFNTTTIKAPKIATADVQQITYRMKLKPGATEPLALPDTGMQTVRSLGDGVLEIVVTRQSHGKAAAGNDAGRKAPPAGDEFLGTNLLMNLEDLELKKVAKEAGGDPAEPFERADRLRRFVRRFISDKSLDIGFATANEVVRTKEGDCSEHGVLLAALGRLNGIPSRVVMGLAYAPIFGGQSDIFGYHMWTQFYIDGRWYDYDAALGNEERPHPGRVAFAVSSLHNAGVADLALPLLSKIGLVELEVVRMEP